MFTDPFSVSLIQTDKGLKLDRITDEENNLCVEMDIGTGWLLFKVEDNFVQELSIESLDYLIQHLQGQPIVKDLQRGLDELEKDGGASLLYARRLLSRRASDTSEPNVEEVHRISVQDLLQAKPVKATLGTNESFHKVSFQVPGRKDLVDVRSCDIDFALREAEEEGQNIPCFVKAKAMIDAACVKSHKGAAAKFALKFALAAVAAGGLVRIYFALDGLRYFEGDNKVSVITSRDSVTIRPDPQGQPRTGTIYDVKEGKYKTIRPNEAFDALLQPYATSSWQEVQPNQYGEYARAIAAWNAHHRKGVVQADVIEGKLHEANRQEQEAQAARAAIYSQAGGALTLGFNI
jgi:hypothetical protein